MQDFPSAKLILGECPSYSGSMPRIANSARSEVGQRLATLRQAQGLTQKQLAEKTGVSQQDIAYWERQAPAPRGEILPKLCSILNVSADELLGIAPPKLRRTAAIGRLQNVFEAASKLPRRQQEKVAEFIEAFVAHQHDTSL